MTSGECLWCRSADVVFARLGGLEWTNLCNMVHVPCLHGYFAGCQGLVSRGANAASKQKGFCQPTIWVVSEVNSNRSKRPVDSPVMGKGAEKGWQRLQREPGSAHPSALHPPFELPSGKTSPHPNLQCRAQRLSSDLILYRRHLFLRRSSLCAGR